MSLVNQDNPASRQSQIHSLSTWGRAHTGSIAGLLCFVLACALRFYHLGSQSLWLDEGGTWAEVMHKSWLTLFSELWSRDAAYPLYHLLLKSWIALAGDSEWALRFPSALAGVAAVVALYAAAREVLLAQTIRQPAWPLIAGLICAASPFAIWHAQDAKVYSLLMFVIALLLWSFLRTLRRADRQAWLLMLGIALISVFIHRLAVLALAGVSLAYLIVETTNTPRRVEPVSWRRFVRGPRLLIALTILLAVVGIGGTILAVRNESLGGSGHIPAGPLLGIWLTLTHFALDRGDVAGFWGIPLVVWALPGLLLTLWGLALLARDARQRQPAAVAVLCLFVVPLGLFAVALAFAPIFEARYVAVAFPAWVLVVAYPLLRTGDRGQGTGGRGSLFVFRLPSFVLRPSSLVAGLLLVNFIVLFQPKHGLFSGDPVKEQWREAISYLAQQAHPDDLVILHPYYAQPMWDYYAPRVTADRLQKPVTFTEFNQGLAFKQTNPQEWFRRNYEIGFNIAAAGKKRALLLIAPEHARTIDPPLDPQKDLYGRVGLRFAHSEEQKTWPCGGSGDQFIGVEVMCQSFPDTFNAGGSGKIPQPMVPLEATFGGELKLRGYTLSLFDGVAQPGGTLPVTLYWAATAPPTHNYRMFLHLCRDCTNPPLANDDGPPLKGYEPAGNTTAWLVGDPVHDERTLKIPADLPPGRYTLLLGVYASKDDRPSANDRLPIVTQAPQLDDARLVLGEVEVTAPQK